MQRAQLSQSYKSIDNHVTYLCKRPKHKIVIHTPQPLNDYFNKLANLANVGVVSSTVNDKRNVLLLARQLTKVSCRAKIRCFYGGFKKKSLGWWWVSDICVLK